ncbi:hypothetical protein MNBD_GAMMA07-471 [hydrothermal vent metagenome]|uniref:Uncharacterized protein n=1 Tax=hydrothermal vent metagenome TaxID=652676 RepID=A0A3B0X5M8_9ZZZZ
MTHKYYKICIVILVHFVNHTGLNRIVNEYFRVLTIETKRFRYPDTSGYTMNGSDHSNAMNSQHHWPIYTPVY